VIIESDSLGAWLGLIGVLTGAAVATATTWVQRWYGDRSDRRKALEAAKGQLIAAATSLIVLVTWYHGARRIEPESQPRNALGSESEWVEKIAKALERVQIADRTIQLDAGIDIAVASGLIVSQATDYARGYTRDPEELDRAITSFKATWSRAVAESETPPKPVQPMAE
jgi:hypothetical protein